MMLVAWELGIGSCPATVYEQDWPASSSASRPGCLRYILSFGYPADPTDAHRPAEAGGRRPLDDVLHRERW